MGEKSGVSKRGSRTSDPILEFAPLPRFPGDGVDVKDVVTPVRLVRPVQEEMVGIGKGKVWDWGEQ